MTRCSGPGGASLVADTLARRKFDKFMASLSKSSSGATFIKEEHCRKAVTAAVCAGAFPRCTDDDDDEGDENEDDGGARCPAERLANVPIADPQADPLFFKGVCLGACLELATKCGIPSYLCSTAWEMPAAEPCDMFAVDPAVGCHEPFSSSLDFCSAIQHPVLSAPWDTRDTWVAMDKEALSATKSLLAHKGGPGKCADSLKNFFCTINLPQCFAEDNFLVPICRSACTEAVRCGLKETRLLNCSDDRLFSDEPTCVMYSKEPQPDKLAVIVLIVTFLTLFILVAATLANYLLRKRKKGYKPLAGGINGDDFEDGIELIDDPDSYM